VYNNRVSIQELSLKFKGFFSNTEVLLAGLIVIVGVSSFALGRVSVPRNMGDVDTEAAVMTSEKNKGEILETVSADAAESIEAPVISQAEGGYVASKNGTKYHLPWCGSAKQIKEENKIWFATKEEAERAGYTPASNCKGI
jgi:hypothetical protein